MLGDDEGAWAAVDEMVMRAWCDEKKIAGVCRKRRRARAADLIRSAKDQLP